MKLLRVALLSTFLLMISTEFGGAQNDITVTPPTNQTIAFGSDMNVTYNCNVSEGSTAEWVFRDIQLTPGSQVVNTLRGLGIFIEDGATARESRIIVTRAARETGFMNADIELRCSALSQSDVFIRFGDFLYVRVFFTPNIPQNLDFNPLPTNLSRLELTWDEPDNTLIDTGDPVVTTYTVTVSGPTFDFTDTTTDTRYEIVDSLDKECAEHNFQVHASNGAGAGPADFINETIPISPDIRNLGSQLSVTSIIFTPSRIEIEVTFPRAVACSPNFPLNSYEVNFIGVDTVTFPVTDPRIAGRELITLEVTSSLIQPDQDYSLSVSACISVTCRESPPVTFRTTDVQSANIVFFENNLYLTCSFASSSPARGCGFIFTASSNITEEFNVSQSESGLCTQLQNMENVYTSIMALDWESDGSYGNLLTVPTRNRTMTEEEYMAATGCTLPTTPTPSVEVVSEGLSGGAIAGIVIAVIAVALIATAIVVVIVILAKRHAQNVKKAEKSKYEDRLRRDNGELHADCTPEECRLPPPGALAGPPPPFLDPADIELLPQTPDNDAKFVLKLEEGHKQGKISINLSMLDKLRAVMTDNDKTEMEYNIPLLGGEN